jgi:hypothetical protein
VLKHFITAYYFIDILLNFNTGYYEKNELVIDRELIARKYLRLYFWIDMIATVPFEAMFVSDDAQEATNDSSNNYISLLRFFKFFRLLRCPLI